MRRLTARAVAILAIVAGAGLGATAVDAVAAPVQQHGITSVGTTSGGVHTASADWWW